MGTDKVKVAIRVRPFNRRETELATQCIVQVKEEQIHLYNADISDQNDKKSPKTFAFDHCFDSCDVESEEFANQEKVFQCLGKDILDNAFDGYNACVLAYGQTGSGKSYTMMGTVEQKGIIPRLCDTLFERIASMQSSEHTCKVEVSYMEIYNEKVRDLLDPKTNKQALKVREHKVLGPYVDGLSQLAVTSYEDIDKLMTEGNKSRTVAATNMNSESSRSHAVFSVILTQTLTDPKSGVSGEKVSRLSLVDLAGSERATKTGAIGDRLKEGSNINKSLTTLGLVISKLADQSNTKNKDKFVPYRDSVLTWLLKDNLGGNSRTIMIATVSPSADNYEETLSTLRYADRAKSIVNHAVVNEDPNARIIRELRQEVELLKNMLLHATGASVTIRTEDLHEKLSENERLMKGLSETWEEKLVKTERLQHERQEALESMGISVMGPGIMVEKNKYYLVNLNADPSLNEMLVYYLKERTLVGSNQGDIQLPGLGIQSEHCVITIENDSLFMEPLPGARCYINGAAICEKSPLKHGDRVLWGHHHFFRVNCPKASPEMAGSTASPQQTIDYNFAREELMLHEFSDDPIQVAIAKIEKQHEEDKQVALERQRQEYEKHFQHLRNALSPSTPYSPHLPYDPFRVCKSPVSPNSQLRIEQWAKERDELFRKSIIHLKADIVEANALAQEANYLSDELGKNTTYSVTLQIPPTNLGPNRKKGSFVCEPAILVKRKECPNQVWLLEKLENRLVEMREMFEEYNSGYYDNDAYSENNDPFFDDQENHILIGVANVFLEVLFHDVILDYQTPIINQQGEVTGKLRVEIGRVCGSFPQDRICEAASDISSNTSSSSSDDNAMGTSEIVIEITIKEASGLPPCKLVFCQYNVFGLEETIVVPSIDVHDGSQDEDGLFAFQHSQRFIIAVSEELIEHCAEGALSIEVWGHLTDVQQSKPDWFVEKTQIAKARSLIERWSELTRKIELWVEVQELNDEGEYYPVEVEPANNLLTGGIYQLRQGQQRRVQIYVRPVQNSGTLPIICDCITSVAVGCVVVRNCLQKPLDSYQDDDLAMLRDKWSEALMKRREYLDQHIQELLHKTDKSEKDKEREHSLVEQWVSLTEERNAVLVPQEASGIPGSPSNWIPPVGMEPHVPVLFLDLNADDLSTSNYFYGSFDDIPLVGHNSILPKEMNASFYNLPIIRYMEKDVSAIASWDSSVHDNPALNKITDASERVYVILKASVRLSHPAPMELVLRKRLCLRIYKRQSLAGRLMKRLVRTDPILRTGVTYEIVSNIPKSVEELEERESLAQLAASGMSTSFSDGETYIEKYSKSVNAVESILMLDKLRQKVAVREEILSRGRKSPEFLSKMIKTSSVPNFSQVMRFDSIDVLTSKAAMTFGSVIDLATGSKLAKDGSLKPENVVSTKPHSVPGSHLSKLGSRMGILLEEHVGKTGHLDDADSSRESILINDQTPGLTPSTTSSGYQSEMFGSSNMLENVRIQINDMDISGQTKSSGNSHENGDAAASEDNKDKNIDTVIQITEESIFKPNVNKSDALSSVSGCDSDDFPSSRSPTNEDDTKYEMSSSVEMSTSTSSELGDDKECDSEMLEEWMIIGESVLIRPQNMAGVISFVGKTQFAKGTWIGVTLNTPSGKNDGSVKGVQYFKCPFKHGIFVRPNKLIVDKRGKDVKKAKSNKS